MKQRDSRWKKNTSPESFIDLAKTIVSINPEVPDDIKKSFKVVERLIEFSYYEYEFLDSALERSFIIFEMALRLKYIDVEKPTKDAEEPDFKKLVNWANNNSFIEVEKRRVQKLRKMRNNTIHKTSYQLTGNLSIDIIRIAIQWINDLYSSPTDRIERKRVLRKVKQEIKKFDYEGGILYLPKKEVIVTNIELIKFDNIAETNTYTFLISTHFYLPDNISKVSEHPKSLDGVEIPTPIFIECTRYEIGETFINFYDTSNNNNIVLISSTEESRRMIKQWKEEIKNSVPTLNDLISHVNSEAWFSLQFRSSRIDAHSDSKKFN